VAIALFGKPSLTFHLGLDQPKVAASDWYQQKSHPYLQAIAQIMDDLATWHYIHQLEFLVSPGVDPLTNLQVQLDRQSFSLNQPPSSIFNHLQTQKIYSFGSR
jgi:3,4-dihydroxy 2-butanone 4-phosphate synthase/GTP cyclohydrolase II